MFVGWNEHRTDVVVIDEEDTLRVCLDEFCVYVLLYWQDQKGKVGKRRKKRTRREQFPVLTNTGRDEKGLQWAGRPRECSGEMTRLGETTQARTVIVRTWEREMNEASQFGRSS